MVNIVYQNYSHETWTKSAMENNRDQKLNLPLKKIAFCLKYEIVCEVSEGKRRYATEDSKGNKQTGRKIIITSIKF